MPDLAEKVASGYALYTLFGCIVFCLIVMIACIYLFVTTKDKPFETVKGTVDSFINNSICQSRYDPRNRNTKYYCNMIISYTAKNNQSYKFPISVDSSKSYVLNEQVNVYYYTESPDKGMLSKPIPKYMFLLVFVICLFLFIIFILLFIYCWGGNCAVGGGILFAANLTSNRY
jgi:hypothetical protein